MGSSLLYLSLTVVLCTYFISSGEATVTTVTKCETDTFSYFDWPTPPFPVTRSVTFSSNFTSKPVITYGITQMDVNYAQNVRAFVTTVSLNSTVWIFSIYSLFDTELYSLGISFMACGN